MSFIWPTLLLTLLCVPLLVLLYLRLQQRRRKFAAQYGSLGLAHNAKGIGPGMRRHIPALTLSATQSNELNVCWNSVYRLIFGFNKWESVKSFINGLGRLNFTFLAKLRRCKLYFHLIYSENVALYNLFWTFLLDNFHNDDCLALVFTKKHDAITQLYNKFDDLCTQS